MTMTTWESFKVSTLFDYNLFTHTFDVRDSLISNQWERKFAYWEFFFTSKMMTNFCAIKFFLFQAMMHEAGLLLCEIIRSFRLYKKKFLIFQFLQLLFLPATLWKDLNNGERRWIDGILMMCDVIKMRI